LLQRAVLRRKSVLPGAELDTTKGTTLAHAVLDATAHSIGSTFTGQDWILDSRSAEARS